MPHIERTEGRRGFASSRRGALRPLVERLGRPLPLALLAGLGTGAIALLFGIDLLPALGLTAICALALLLFTLDNR